MVNNTLNTIIVLRNDSSVNWAASDTILLEGEVGVSKLPNGNVVVKVGDGAKKWVELPQVESVLEDNMLLTHSFGKHTVPAGGFVNAGGKDMTFSQWFADALKETVNPTITQPSVSMTASVSNSGADLEIGSYIKKISWAGTPSTGSYTIGTSTQATGLEAGDFTWAVSNSIDAQTSTLEDGTFTLTSDKFVQINSDTKATYARIDATVTLDTTDAVAPKNNLGEEVDGKITGFDTEGTKTKTLFADVQATGYRNTWQYVGEDCTTAINSTFIRGCTPKNKNTTSFGTVTIPDGTKRVMFAVPGAHTLTSVIDVDGMNLDVKGNFETKTIAVEGANNFTAIDYTVFVAENPAGLAATKYTVTIA